VHVCVCIAHINPTKGPSGMDYNMFKRLFTKYSYQVDAPEVKTFSTVRPKCPLVGVKKAVIQQENSILGCGILPGQGTRTEASTT